ncbi:MAG: polysaccharide deacetylase family protein [Nitrospiraceae bacterium]
MRLLSFDVEDWFHILDNTSTRTEHDWVRYPSRLDASIYDLLDVLDHVGCRATFFCLGWIARRNPNTLRRIAARGHEIACHSDMHQLVYDLKKDNFRADLRKAIGSLEDAVGAKVLAYRAPGFSVRDAEASWFFDALIEEGMQVDCSVFVGRHGHGGLPQFPSVGPCKVNCAGGTIKEFPMTGAKLLGQSIVYSGGGYFRLMPYWLVRFWANRADYLMTYFHPRDFDPHQPVVPGLSPIRRFKSYYGLASSLEKLKRLLNDFEFTNIGSAVAATNWDCVPQITLGSKL